MNTKMEKPGAITSLRSGYYIYQQGQIYQVVDGDKKDGLVVCVKSLTTGEQVQFSVLEIFKPSDRKKLTIIARTLQELQFEIAAASQTVELSDTKAVLPEKLLGKANKIIETVEQIPKKIRNGSKSSFCSWEWS